MQNINITVQSGNQIEEYYFALFDTTLVFDRFWQGVKEQGKRKYQRVAYWERLRDRDCTIPEPVVPNEVKQAALNQLIVQCSVKTWAEYKSR